MDINKNNEYDELINRYISGDMNDSEKSELLTSLDKDVVFRNRAQMLGLIIKEIQQINGEKEVKTIISQTTEDDFVERVKQLRNKKHADNCHEGQCSTDGICDKEQTKVPAKIKKLFISRKWYYSIAAGIIVIIGMFTVYQKMSSPDLMGIGNRQDLQMITYSRGMEDSLMVVDLNESFNVIKTGNARDAVNKLTELLSKTKNNPTIENHRAEIMWNLAIAYMILEDKANAIKSLEEVVSSAEDTPLASKAKQLIKELE